MPLMLHIVENGRLRTRAEKRRGEAGVQQRVEPQVRRRQWQRRLFPEKPSRAKRTLAHPVAFA